MSPSVCGRHARPTRALNSPVAATAPTGRLHSSRAPVRDAPRLTPGRRLPRPCRSAPGRGRGGALGSCRAEVTVAVAACGRKASPGLASRGFSCPGGHHASTLTSGFDRRVRSPSATRCGSRSGHLAPGSDSQGCLSGRSRPGDHLFLESPGVPGDRKPWNQPLGVVAGCLWAAVLRRERPPFLFLLRGRQTDST